MITRWGLRSSDVWDEMSRLSREMNRLFGQTASTPSAGVFPPLNLYDDGESLVLRTEVPGIDPSELEIQATFNQLTIKGERKRPEVEESASYHRRERGYGNFSRTIDLPYEVNPDKVQASYKLGVLEVMLPKADEAKPRKIAINS